MTDDSKRLEAHAVTVRSEKAKQAAQSAKAGKETGSRPNVNLGRPATR